jgi:hypothetical protein
MSLREVRNPQMKKRVVTMAIARRLLELGPSVVEFSTAILLTMGDAVGNLEDRAR